MSEEMPTITDRLLVRRQRRPGGDSHLTQRRGPPPGLAGLSATCLGTVICDTTSRDMLLGDPVLHTVGQSWDSDPVLCLLSSGQARRAGAPAINT